MIIDTSYFDSAQIAPVVIVGSGPAGVSLAVRLAENGVESVILEAGGHEYDEDSQNFYVGKTVGDDYFDLDTTRLRFFGGSSNHWAGWCRPLDTWDFEERDNIPNTGWPIGKQDLDPFLGDARDILEVGATGSRPLNEDLIETGFQQSPPVMFGEKYENFFTSSEIAHIALSHPVESLESVDGRVSAIHLRMPSGDPKRIEPQVVVLATGGIENSRLLLWSNEVSPQRVVQDDRALGRYWMEHPHATIGEARITRNFDQLRLNFGEVRVGPTPEAMERHGILNGALRFFRTISGTSTLKDASKRLICATEPLSGPALALADISVRCETNVEIAYEQAPDPENRITLSAADSDAFGVPRVELHWRKNEIDYRTPKVILELFGQYLQRENRGMARAAPHTILEQSYPNGGMPGGHHHMGGTRMGKTSATAVVDRNLAVFGQSNLFVLGSSVFPTGGHANPTLTIVQLALRLGDHIKEII